MIHRMSPGGTGRCQSKKCHEKKGKQARKTSCKTTAKGERLNSTGKGDVADVKLEFTDLALWRAVMGES